MDRAKVIGQLTAAINIRLDVPLLNESQEAWVIQLVLWQAVPLLDDEMLEWMQDASDGVSTEEVSRLVSLLAAVICRYVNLPLIPDAYERAVVEQVLGAVLVYVGRGMALVEQAA